MAGSEDKLPKDAHPAADRSYVALPPGATSTTTQWHDRAEVEALWMLSGAYLLFFGQAGFALLEAGHVRSSHTRQVTIKVLLQACVVAVCWWAVGYPFAFGEGGPHPNVFIGGKDWFLGNSSSQPDPNQQPELFPLWMLQMAYCCMAVAVASCALAERGRLVAHVLLAIAMSSWIYPVVVHWIWSTEGWLSGRNNYGSLLGANGFIDCAGSCTVHVVAGTVGLVGCYIIGPTQCRLTYATSGAASSAGSSLLLSSLGGLFLWFSWYGLAPSNLVMMVSSILVAARVSVALTLSAAAGCLAVFCCSLTAPELNLRAALDGALAGLVAISASASVVEMYGAFIIGIVGGAAYLAGIKVASLLQLDDPVNIVAVHLLPGLWGAVAPGVFATPALLAAGGYAAPDGSAGIFYGGDGKQLGIQLLGTVVVTAWSLVVSVLLFMGLKYCQLLRVTHTAESLGWGVREDDAEQDCRAVLSISANRRQARNSKNSASMAQNLAGCQGADAAVSAASQHHHRPEAAGPDEHCMARMQYYADSDCTGARVPSFITAEMSQCANRASSMGGGPAGAGFAGLTCNYSHPGLAHPAMRMPSAAAAAAGGWRHSCSGVPDGLSRMAGSSNSLEAPPSGMLPAELQPFPYGSNGNSITAGTAPALRGSLVSAGGSGTAAVAAFPGRGWPNSPTAGGSFVAPGGPRAGSSGSPSPSPDLSAIRACSMLVLHPSSASGPQVLGGELGLERSSSANLAAGRQQMHQIHGYNFAARSTSNSGSRGIVQGNNCYINRVGNSSRASSPAELSLSTELRSASMDLRRGLMVASCSASYPAAPLMHDSVPPQSLQQLIQQQQRQQSLQHFVQQQQQQQQQGSKAHSPSYSQPGLVTGQLLQSQASAAAQESAVAATMNAATADAAAPPLVPAAGALGESMGVSACTTDPLSLQVENEHGRFAEAAVISSWAGRAAG